MTFELLQIGVYCPHCSKRLRLISIKGQDGCWYKVWGCGCVASPEEAERWDAEEKMLREEPKATA